jgi:hypothetical protein
MANNSIFSINPQHIIYACLQYNEDLKFFNSLDKTISTVIDQNTGKTSLPAVIVYPTINPSTSSSYSAADQTYKKINRMWSLWGENFDPQNDSEVITSTISLDFPKNYTFENYTQRFYTEIVKSNFLISEIQDPQIKDLLQNIWRTSEDSIKDALYKKFNNLKKNIQCILIPYTVAAGNAYYNTPPSLIDSSKMTKNFENTKDNVPYFLNGMYPNNSLSLGAITDINSLNSSFFDIVKKYMSYLNSGYRDIHALVSKRLIPYINRNLNTDHSINMNQLMPGNVHLHGINYVPTSLIPLTSYKIKKIKIKDSKTITFEEESEDSMNFNAELDSADKINVYHLINEKSQKIEIEEGSQKIKMKVEQEKIEMKIIELVNGELTKFFKVIEETNENNITKYKIKNQDITPQLKTRFGAEFPDQINKSDKITGLDENASTNVGVWSANVPFKIIGNPTFNADGSVSIQMQPLYTNSTVTNQGFLPEKNYWYNIKEAGDSGSTPIILSPNVPLVFSRPRSTFNGASSNEKNSYGTINNSNLNQFNAFTAYVNNQYQFTWNDATNIWSSAVVTFDPYQFTTYSVDTDGTILSEENQELYNKFYYTTGNMFNTIEDFFTNVTISTPLDSYTSQNLINKSDFLTNSDPSNPNPNTLPGYKIFNAFSGQKKFYNESGNAFIQDVCDYSNIFLFPYKAVQFCDPYFTHAEQWKAKHLPILQKMLLNTETSERQTSEKQIYDYIFMNGVRNENYSYLYLKYSENSQFVLRVQILAKPDISQTQNVPDSQPYYLRGQVSPKFSIDPVQCANYIVQQPKNNNVCP